MSQDKKMRVFKLTDSQLDLMLQSIRRTKRTSYEKHSIRHEKTGGKVSHPQSWNVTYVSTSPDFTVKKYGC